MSTRLRRLVRATVAAVLVAPLLLGFEVTSQAVPTAGDPAVDPALAPYYQQTLQWRSCRGGDQCTTLRVPLSYDDLSLGDAQVRMLRVRAGNPSARIGSLVINPGGPGGSGVEFASFAPFLFSTEVLERYDIVGFDPRGITASDPAVSCLTNRQTGRWIDADPAPDTAKERDAYESISRTMATGCIDRTPGIATHMDTDLVARDLDVMRAVLGDDVLHYLGFSYGTAIGTAYAEAFPQRAGRLVLDGAIDPTLTLITLSKGQSDGFQQALRRFAKDCPRHADCPLPSSTSKALRRIQRFLEDVDRHPVPARRGRPLVVGQAITGIIGSLYDDGSGWPGLRYALSAGFRGNGRPLQDITDSFTNRRADGTYASNSNVALYAVSCWDYPRPPSRRGTRDLADSWAAEAAVPDLAATLAWGNLPCRYWAGRTTVPPHEVHAPGAPPILVVGTRYDPATPVQWARALAAQLDSGVFLEWIGDGHTAYGRGSRCVQDAVDTFLLTGRPPADGTVCG